MKVTGDKKSISKSDPEKFTKIPSFASSKKIRGKNQDSREMSKYERCSFEDIKGMMSNVEI